jgi:hypothetical protein
MATMAWPGRKRRRSALSGADGGASNILLIGGDDLPDAADLNKVLGRQGSRSVAITGTDLEAFIGDAVVLTDDFAPVDQLVGRP